MSALRKQVLHRRDLRRDRQGARRTASRGIVTGTRNACSLDGLVRPLPAAIAAASVGLPALRCRSGHLQGYTFVLGAGIVPGHLRRGVRAAERSDG